MTASILAAIRDLGGRDRHTEARTLGRLAPQERPLVRVGCAVLGESLFRDALARERKRTERFGTGFAVLVVDRSHAASETGPWVPVLRAVEAVKRDLDAAGWLE